MSADQNARLAAMAHPAPFADTDDGWMTAAGVRFFIDGRAQATLIVLDSTLHLGLERAENPTGRTAWILYVSDAVTWLDGPAAGQTVSDTESRAIEEISQRAIQEMGYVAITVRD